MASQTQRMWVWGSSGSWQWTGRPGVLPFMASQRVGHDWATELNWILDLQCCVNFCCSANWFGYTHTHRNTHSFHCGLFITGYWIYYQFPVLYSRTLLFIHPICSNLPLLVPNSSPSHPISPPLWQLLSLSLCLWVCFCFLHKFTCVIF